MFIQINKKKLPVQEASVTGDVLDVFQNKADENKISLEELVKQSLANHWMQNDRFRKSDKAIVNALLRLAYDFDIRQLKIANGRIKVLNSLND